MDDGRSQPKDQRALQSAPEVPYLVAAYHCRRCRLPAVGWEDANAFVTPGANGPELPVDLTYRTDCHSPHRRPFAGIGPKPVKKTVNHPPFPICTSMLLTDGTVMCDGGTQFNGGTGQWCRLTPNSTGSYVNGTWSVMPSMPAGYTPLYYANVVLADGRVICIGGEYNGSNGSFTNLGALYNPVTNAWSNFAGPASWDAIGDASGMVLADGRFMLANPLTQETAIYNPVTNTWAAPGIKNKVDINDEEGWTLLPSNKVLTVDVWNEIWDNNTGDLLSDMNTSELYDPVTDMWSLAGSVGIRLVDNFNEFTGSFEMGPQVLRPDGTVIAFGATGHNAVYNSVNGQWSIAPDFPSVGGVPLDCADAPACILPNGHVLVVTSPGVFGSGSVFFDWDGTKLNAVPTNSNAASDSSFFYRMLVLPTGEVLVTDGSSTVEIYQGGNNPQNAWRPTIATAPTTVISGQTYALTGTQFNGFTQGGMYGDDAGAGHQLSSRSRYEPYRRIRDLPPDAQSQHDGGRDRGAAGIYPVRHLHGPGKRRLRPGRRRERHCIHAATGHHSDRRQHSGESEVRKRPRRRMGHYALRDYQRHLRASAWRKLEGMAVRLRPRPYRHAVAGRDDPGERRDGYALVLSSRRYAGSVRFPKRQTDGADRQFRRRPYHAGDLLQRERSQRVYAENVQHQAVYGADRTRPDNRHRGSGLCHELHSGRLLADRSNGRRCGRRRNRRRRRSGRRDLRPVTSRTSPPNPLSHRERGRAASPFASETTLGPFLTP